MYQHHIEKLTRTRLDDVLLDEGVLDRSRIADAQAEHEMTGKSLSGILLDQQAIDEWDLAKVVISHYSLPFIDLTDLNLGLDVESVLPLDFCRAHTVLPLDEFGTAFTLAVCEMPSTLLLQKIIEVSSRTPFLYVAVRRQISEAIDAVEKRKAKRNGYIPGMPATASAPQVSLEPKPLPTAAAAKAPASESVHPPFEPAPPPTSQNAHLVPLSGILPVSLKLSASVTIRSRKGREERKPTAVAAPSPADSGWQSIFDMGDDAVHKNG